MVARSRRAARVRRLLAKRMERCASGARERIGEIYEEGSMSIDNPIIALIYVSAIGIVALIAAIPGGLDRRENIRLRMENAELRRRISKSIGALHDDEDAA